MGGAHENRDERWPLLVCAFPSPPYGKSVQHNRYVHGIVGHAGVCHLAVELDELAARLPQAGILLTVGECKLTDDQRRAIADFVSRGGGWVSVGGVCGMERVLGVEAVLPAYRSWGGATVSTIGEGYLVPAVQDDHPITGHIDAPLHYFNGTAARCAGATALATALDAHGRPTDRVLLTTHDHGSGRAIFVAPDVTGTVIRVQQGISIAWDGVPAPDGTAPITDGVLKSGDGAVLDWTFDRQPVPGVPGLSAFLRPVADRWRELLLRAIFHLATDLRVPLPLLWLYPRGLRAVAHLSHDTDGNDLAACRHLLDLVNAEGIRSTWCVIAPGPDRETLAAVRDAGHELAMHYDAVSEGLGWGEDNFDTQWRTLCGLFGGDRSPVTNKNHYLRWEGDCEFFDWCHRRGVQLDQSKGASKSGEAGFNFGTCHPYFPVTFGGRSIDVLELPTPTQDLEVFIPAAFAQALLDATIKAHGIFHLLFHPAHTIKPAVAAAMTAAIRLAKSHGLEWWTAAQLNAWERARRRIRWSAYDPGRRSVRVDTPTPLLDATTLWLQPGGGDFTAWGFTFSARTGKLGGGTSEL